MARLSNRFLFTFLICALVTYAIGCGGGPTGGSSPDAQKPVGISVDAVYFKSTYVGDDVYNVFADGKAMSIAEDAFEVVDDYYHNALVVTFSNPTEFARDWELINFADGHVDTIFNAAHKAKGPAHCLQYPYFVFSANYVADGSGNPDQYTAGYTTFIETPGQAPWPVDTTINGSDTTFSFPIRYSFVFNESLDDFIIIYEGLFCSEENSMSCQLARHMRGVTLAHELGHYYAALTEYDHSGHSTNSCIMNQQSPLEYSTYFKDLLVKCAFCLKCQGHIKDQYDPEYEP